MKLNPSETTLVIAGAWNSAIVTPDWILRHCMDAGAGTGLRVQAHIPTGVGLTIEFPRFTMGDFTFTARPDALVLNPVRSDEHCIASAEQVALRALEILSHTPVGGLGHNFEFVDEHPPTEVLGSFTAAQQDLTDLMPAGWAVRGSAIATSFAGDHYLVNVQRNFREGKLIVKFNFHYDVNSAADCAAVIRREHGETSMLQNLERAREFVTNIYGGLDDENEPEAST